MVVNADGRSIAPTETFIRNHIKSMPADVITVVGNSGYRTLESTGRYLQSRALVPLALRWAARKVGLATVASQDARLMAAFIQASRIDCVFAEYGMTGASVTEACRAAQVPLVVHFHGYDAYRQDILHQYRDQYRNMFGYASAVIAVSTHMRQQLIRLGADESRVIYNSCGAELQDIVPKRSAQRRPKTFIAVGRLTPKKAQHVVIQAFAAVHRAHPDARLRILGGGECMPALEALVAALGLHDAVTFFGSVSHQDALAAMNDACCFVQHSVVADNGDMEGTPVAVLEAMSLGLPIVATRHGGICDAITDEITGLLVDEYDVEATAAAMIRVIENPRQAEEMAEEARREALAKWGARDKNEKVWATIETASRRPIPDYRGLTGNAGSSTSA